MSSATHARWICRILLSDQLFLILLLFALAVGKGLIVTGGFALSDHGEIEKVEMILMDKNWRIAKLQKSVLGKAHLRFSHFFIWNSNLAVITSRPPVLPVTHTRNNNS